MSRRLTALAEFLRECFDQNAFNGVPSQQISHISCGRSTWEGDYNINIRADFHGTSTGLLEALKSLDMTRTIYVIGPSGYKGETRNILEFRRGDELIAVVLDKPVKPTKALARAEEAEAML